MNENGKSPALPSLHLGRMLLASTPEQIDQAIQIAARALVLKAKLRRDGLLPSTGVILAAEDLRVGDPK